MKKGTKIAIIVSAIVLVLVVAIIATVFIVVNKEKTSITAEEFQSKMEEKGYSVINAIGGFSTIEEISKAYIALDTENDYQIEFYELKDEESTMLFYNSNKEIFESSKGNSAAETSVSGKNYSKYTLSSNGAYKVISRINNTVIFITEDEEYKDTIQEVLKELGY